MQWYVLVLASLDLQMVVMTSMEDNADIVPETVGMIHPALENAKATLVLFPILAHSLLYLNISLQFVLASAWMDMHLSVSAMIFTVVYKPTSLVLSASINNQTYRSTRIGTERYGTWYVVCGD